MPLAHSFVIFIDTLISPRPTSGVTEWLNLMVKCINANAERFQEKAAENDFRYTRAWHPFDKFDTLTYLAGVIHMGLHPEAEISDYWGDMKDTGVTHRIREYISLKRWQQIDRFYILKNRVRIFSEYLSVYGTSHSMFKRCLVDIGPLARMLQ